MLAFYVMTEDDREAAGPFDTAQEAVVWGDANLPAGSAWWVQTRRRHRSA